MHSDDCDSFKYQKRGPMNRENERRKIEKEREREERES